MTYCCSGIAFGINSILEDRKRDFNAQISSEKAVLFVIPQTELLDLLNINLKMKCKLLSKLGNIYDEMFRKSFHAYRENFGLFELKKMF